MSKIPNKPKDKRTKAYKEWVAKYESNSYGLGDTIEKITKATGVKKVVNKVFDKLGKDCGCDDRKKSLNIAFPYNKPNCFNEEEYNYVGDYLNLNTDTVTSEQQTKLLSIYNRIFNTKDEPTSCGSCFRSKIDRLKYVYDKYND
tara:strand:+ start:29 stop:460 length:432 start_codon:yes stop_codon:yes gene_type:complete